MPSSGGLGDKSDSVFGWMSSTGDKPGIGGEKGGEKVRHGRQPSDFYKVALGRPVVVKLNSATEYRGVLACLDGYMNVALEQTEEYSNGELKAKYGDAFIRGNNVLYISSQAP